MHPDIYKELNLNGQYYILFAQEKLLSAKYKSLTYYLRIHQNNGAQVGVMLTLNRANHGSSKVSTLVTSNILRDRHLMNFLTLDNPSKCTKGLYPITMRDTVTVTTECLTDQQCLS